MNKKTIIILYICLISLSVWILIHFYTAPQEPLPAFEIPTQTPPGGSEMCIQQSYLEYFSPQPDAVVWRIKAQTLEFFTAHHCISGTIIACTLLKNNVELAKLSIPQLYIDTKTHNIRACGNIDGIMKDAQLHTNDLYFHAQSQVLEAPNPINVHVKGLSVEARKAKIFLKEQRLLLRDGVRTTISF